jgi:hypothetical protein
VGPKQFLKRAGYRIAPKVMTAVLSSRARAYSTSLVKQWGLFDLNQKLIAHVGHRVVGGPFAGMVLTRAAEGEHIGPYLLGTYEVELQPWLQEVFLGSYSQIVDIGSNFGYYAIGLARRFPRLTVVAFDTDWWARRAVAGMAAANNVSNVTIHGFCSASWLRDHLQQRALIVSDCEGYERELFCAAPVPPLSTATMIIELHEQTPGDLAAQIRRRFEGTHVIDQCLSRSTTPRPALHVPSLTDEEFERVRQEVRGEQRWLYLRPRVAATA